MPNIIALSESDTTILRRLIEDFRNQNVNTSQRSYQQWPNLHPQDEVLVALTPEGGIPALVPAGTGTGTGTGGGNDVAGFGVCDLYTFDGTDPPFGTLRGLLQPDGSPQDELVYNLSPDPISGSSYITIVKDKYGFWIAQTGGGGPSPSPLPSNVVVVQCISIAIDNTMNVYPGFIQTPTKQIINDQLPLLWTNVQEIRFNPLNGGTPIINHRYGAIPTGFIVTGNNQIIYPVYQLVCTMPSTQSGDFIDG
jgi:hypothetical protein